MRKKQKVKRKLNFKRFFRFIFFLMIIILVSYIVINLPITNIYISGNSILSDQEIIDIAGISNYPSSIQNGSFIIKDRLEKNDMIISANVTKKDLTKVYIEVKENRPLFYNSNTNLVVLLDGTSITSDMITPYLLDYVPNTIYDKFITSMGEINTDVLARISEIQYNPNEVDKERFYLSMDDGNYVYLTLSSFNKINSYIDMIKQFNGKKGILYLDSGEYFEIK